MLITLGPSTGEAKRMSEEPEVNPLNDIFLLFILSENSILNFISKHLQNKIISENNLK